VARPIAHRGLHDLAGGRPENTLAAAEAAMAGRFAIECDIQLSADGEAMVFHDGELGRLTVETGPVRGRSATRLAGLVVAGTAERIPTLTGFLDRIAGRTPLVVEVKSRFDGDERLARRLVEILDGRDAPVAVKSFDPTVVALLRRIAPHLPRGIVAQSRYEEGEWLRLDPSRRREMANLLHWPETEPDFLSWRGQDLPDGPPFLARTLAGAPVMAWTVRDPAEAGRLSAHADQIVFEGFLPA
jgi:glycerophosphoryl diester phosphodiesterase